MTANIYFLSHVCTCEWTRTAAPFYVSFHSSTSDRGRTPHGRCSFLGQRRRTRGNHIWSFCWNTAYVLLAHSPLVPKKSHMVYPNPISMEQENTLPRTREGKKYLKTVIQSITDLSWIFTFFPFLFKSTHLLARNTPKKSHSIVALGTRLKISW